MAPQYVIYSVDSSIESFFHEYTDATRAECDERARGLVGPLKPVPIQGQFSYTVIAGDLNNRKIVQFRAGVSKLDMETMRLAKEVHPLIAPTCIEHEAIGSSRPLSVYEMQSMKGITYIEARESNLQRTVVSLAEYFAESWTKRQTPRSSGHVQREYAESIELLRVSLPTRFSKVIDQAQSKLSLLFRPSYPSALTHDDLNPTNILIGDDSCITGIVDWAGARVLPFGKSLYGLENLLGSMGSGGWRYSDDHSMLEEMFWQKFYCAIGNVTQEDKDTIQVARIIGILFQYGFTWEEGVYRRPTKEGDSRMRYMDAFLSDS